MENTNKWPNLILNLYIQILCESIICQQKQYNVISAAAILIVRMRIVQVVVKVHNQEFLNWAIIYAKEEWQSSNTSEDIVRETYTPPQLYRVRLTNIVRASNA